MLFNSYIFIFLFLPVVLCVYFLLSRIFHGRLMNIWLLVSSLFFYGWGEAAHLPLLACSILANWLLGSAIRRTTERGQTHLAHAIFWIGICGNLALLCRYKYLDFFVQVFDRLLGLSLAFPHQALPLGISFFTITQILALVDCRAGNTKEHGLIPYAAFVSFFPHLMAGPILYHRPMMQQLMDENLHAPRSENLARGLALFILGLAKKLLIADSFIAPVTYGFTYAGALDFWQSWQTVLCYVLELYFDFSGYSDMAVGLARMMNINIPINFNRPFHATSVANFWQRWHISLTNAITACVYMPIVRHLRRPTFSKMLAASAFAFFLVGIWHGAGATFVIFALLQAVGLAVSQIWKHHHLPSTKLGNHVLMFLFIAVSFVFFRAPSLSAARDLLFGMIGRHGIHLPIGIAQAVNPSLTHLIQVSATLPGLPEWTFLTGILLVVFSPDANHLVERLTNCSYLAAALLAVLFLCCVMQLGQTSAFLYFQF